MKGRRVVVTGLGIVSPVGSTIEKSWSNILAGKSGVGEISRFDTDAFGVKIAAEVSDFDVSDYLDRKDARKMDPFIHYGLAASIQAIEDSGYTVTEENAQKTGVIIGSGIGGMETIHNTVNTFEQSGPRRVSPFYVPSTIINMISGHVSIRYGMRGPNLATVTACTTGTHSIGQAARMIAYGDADAMVAGGAEYPITKTAVAGFTTSKALSTRNDDPAAASRPWDAGRDGFVIGEGAGILFLESLDSAQARGAKIYAELAGFGMSGDAFHITAPPEGGAGAAQCMRSALDDAGLNPDDVDFINAHGTSTPLGDRAESDAVKATFGSHAPKLAVTSTKSMTGHLLGAAGGVEAVYTVLALRDQIASPTINLDDPDPDCDLDYVPNKAREMPIRAALSNSFGFGGTNGSLLFTQWRD